MAEITITSPPGYGKIIPLQRDIHAGKGIKPGLDHRWTAKQNAVFLTLEEFDASLFHYPIAFTQDRNTRQLIPVAVLGLGERGNVFVDADGQWQSDAYIPGYVRRFPFCLTQQAGASQEARIICVQEDCLDPTAPALLEADGSPTAAFKEQHNLLVAMEAAQRRTMAFTAELDRLELLLPLNEVIVARTNAQVRLQGLVRVNDEKVHALAPDVLAALARAGYLRAIYTHLTSLDNFSRLADLAVKPQAA
jgi:hypothetical protein